MGGADQVLEKGGLQRHVRQHHAGMPVERGPALEEQRLDALGRIEMRGEAEIERADADAGEIERMVGHHG